MGSYLAAPFMPFFPDYHAGVNGEDILFTVFPSSLPEQGRKPHAVEKWCAKQGGRRGSDAIFGAPLLDMQSSRLEAGIVLDFHGQRQTSGGNLIYRFGLKKVNRDQGVNCTRPIMKLGISLSNR